MKPCERCGAKPNKSGKITFHKKGCPQKDVTIPPVSLEEILPTWPEPLPQPPEESMILEAEKLMGIIPAPPTKEDVVKQCSTCVCCVKVQGWQIECHRFPPSVGQWARVGPGEWCKEWEQKGE